MITVAGEALIDLVVDRSLGVTAHPGGGPFNVARIAGMLGAPCRFLGRFGDDAFGRPLRGELERLHVEVAAGEPTRAPTTLAIVELDGDGTARYRFHLEGTSAAQLSPRDLVPGALADATVIATGGLALVAQPTASTLLGLFAHAPPAAMLVLDPNCRPSAIPDPARYPEAVRRFVEHADIVKCSVEDLRVLDPPADPHAAAHRLLALGPRAVLVTDGPAPIWIHTPGEARDVAVEPVRVIDTVGAGDAFLAGLLAWLAQRGVTRERAGDADTLAEAAAAAARVAGAACTVAGANLPDTFEWR
jgi:fructokinase